MQSQVAPVAPTAIVPAPAPAPVPALTATAAVRWASIATRAGATAGTPGAPAEGSAPTGSPAPPPAPATWKTGTTIPTPSASPSGTTTIMTIAGTIVQTGIEPGKITVVSEPK